MSVLKVVRIRTYFFLAGFVTWLFEYSGILRSRATLSSSGHFFVRVDSGVQFSCTPVRAVCLEGVSGHGVLATLTFQANTTGRFPLKITKAAVVQPDQQPTAASGSEITVSVQ
jgi:hypothetical protein